MLGTAKGLSRVPPAFILSLRFLRPGETGFDVTRPFLWLSLYWNRSHGFDGKEEEPLPHSARGQREFYSGSGELPLPLSTTTILGAGCQEMTLDPPANVDMSVPIPSRQHFEGIVFTALGPCCPAPCPSSNAEVREAPWLALCPRALELWQGQESSGLLSKVFAI